MQSFPKNELSLAQTDSVNQEKDLLICPRCLEKAHRHGYRTRVLFCEGRREEKQVQRGKCAGGCLRTFTELPEGILPYKRYPESVVTQAVESFETGLAVKDCSAPAEESTLRRWRREFALKLQLFIAVLFTAIRWKGIELPVATLSANKVTVLKEYTTILYGAAAVKNYLGRCFRLLSSHHLRVGCPAAG